MSREIPKTIKSFEHIYYLDEEVQRLVEKYNPDEMVNRIMQENKQLKEKIEELKQTNLITIDYQDLEQRNKNLNSILTELEEWLKERIEWNKSILKEDAGKSDLLGFNFHREAYIKIWEDTLDKMQELKEKYKC